MKKLPGLLLVAVLAAGLVGLAGCGGGSVSIKTDNGEVRVSDKNGSIDVDKKNKTVEVETDKGKAEVSTKMPTEEELGAPIYPGAKMDENAAGSVTTKNSSGKTVYTAAVFWTEDPVDKVITWYRDELKGNQNFIDLSSSAGGESIGIFQYMSGDSARMVSIGKGEVDNPGKTVIAITGGTGADVTNPVK